MKVCLLSKMFPPITGGSAMYAYEIANSLGDRGHNVDVYTQSEVEDESTLEVHDNATVHTLTNSRRYLVTFETLYYSIRARAGVDLDDYDVIHGTLMPSSTIALGDRVTFDTPIVLTSHSFALSAIRYHTPEKPADYLLKYVFHPMNAVMDAITARRADRVIAISKSMERKFVEQYRIPADRVITITHGVDTEHFRPVSNQYPETSEDKLTLLFVGRLNAAKGPQLAVKALAESEFTDVELLIAGSGRQRKALERQASELGVADDVHFLGHVSRERLPRLYSSADLTLFLSTYEGFGLVFMESLAAGTPVIGVAIGGFPDLVTDGQEGILVERDAKAIARAIESLADAPEQIREMGRHARKLAEGHTWDAVAEETEHVYRNILENDALDPEL
ncbi:glycosyltransferase family 4 protein [Salinibaculum sp. GCM10025337]